MQLKTVTESKPALLATRQANESETRCRGKEYDFIWKTGRARRWQSRVPEKPSYRGLDASFFYRIRQGSKVKRQNREGEAGRK